MTTSHPQNDGQQIVNLLRERKRRTWWGRNEKRVDAALFIATVIVAYIAAILLLCLACSFLASCTTLTPEQRACWERHHSWDCL
jgi:hypothetical protein